MAFHFVHDLTKTDAKSRGEPDHVEQANVAFASLNVPDIGSMDAGLVSEGFLRNAGGGTKLPHGLAESCFGPGFLAHEAKARTWTTIRLQTISGGGQSKIPVGWAELLGILKLTPVPLKRR
jgi:hypothetical protein